MGSPTRPPLKCQMGRPGSTRFDRNFFRRLYNTSMEDLTDQQSPEFSSKTYFECQGPSQAQKDLLNEAPISPTEISMGIKNLATGKATGLDNISNEMLQIASPSCKLFLQLLFNRIYSTSHFPSPWKTAYITTLHKRGTKQDPANYRPISITSCFGKLFTSILNTRLMHFMKEANISHPFQGAFSKGKGVQTISLRPTHSSTRLNTLTHPCMQPSSTCKRHMTASIDLSCSVKWSYPAWAPNSVNWWIICRPRPHPVSKLGTNSDNPSPQRWASDRVTPCPHSSSISL